MVGCSYAESCHIVNSLIPDFPMSLRALKQKICDGDYRRCPRYQRCEAGNCDAARYEDDSPVLGIVKTRIQKPSIVKR